MTDYKVEKLLEFFRNASQSEASVTGASNWILFNKSHASDIVRIWKDRILTETVPEKKLALLYIANHVLCTSKKHGTMFVKAFGDILPSTMHELGKSIVAPAIIKKMESVFLVWQQRSIFSVSLQAQISSSFNDKKPSAASENPVTPKSKSHLPTTPRSTASLAEVVASIPAVNGLLEAYESVSLNKASNSNLQDKIDVLRAQLGEFEMSAAQMADGTFDDDEDKYIVETVDLNLDQATSIIDSYESELTRSKEKCEDLLVLLGDLMEDQENIVNDLNEELENGKIVEIFLLAKENIESLEDYVKIHEEAQKARAAAAASRSIPNNPYTNTTPSSYTPNNSYRPPSVPAWTTGGTNYQSYGSNINPYHPPSGPYSASPATNVYNRGPSYPVPPPAYGAAPSYTQPSITPYVPPYQAPPTGWGNNDRGKSNSYDRRPAIEDKRDGKRKRFS